MGWTGAQSVFALKLFFFFGDGNSLTATQRAFLTHYMFCWNDAVS